MILSRDLKKKKKLRRKDYVDDIKTRVRETRDVHSIIQRQSLQRRKRMCIQEYNITAIVSNGSAVALHWIVKRAFDFFFCRSHVQDLCPEIACVLD